MGSLVNRTLRLLAAVLILFSMSYAQAPGTPKPRARGISREQADRILDELRQIRRLLETEQGSGAIAAELRLLRQAMERQQAAAQPRHRRGSRRSPRKLSAQGQHQRSAGVGTQRRAPDSG